MPWSGGSYTKGNNATGGWTGDASLGIGIEAGRHDTQDNDFATGINQCLNKDGSNAATGPLNAGGFKVTNAANATVATDVVTLGQAEAGISTSGTALNITNTQFSNNGTGVALGIRKSRGATVGTNTIVQNGDAIGSIVWQGANGTGYTDAAAIGVLVTGTPGATNDMPASMIFATTPDGSGTFIERMRIDSTGAVGIGATAPTVALQVNGGTINVGGLTSPVAHFAAASASNNNAGIVAGSVNGNAPYIAASKLGDGSSTPMLFFTNDVERMRIGGDGKVGIGEASAGAKLHVRDNASGFTGIATNNQDQRLELLSYYQLGIGQFGAVQSIINSTAAANALVLNPNGGNVSIGSTSAVYRLQVNTDSAAKPTTNTWTIASDERIKTNIQNYTKGLVEICQVRPVTYDYNGKGGFEAGPGGVSIIAQEIQSIFPECVGSVKAKLEPEDTEEVDLFNYNGHAITFALINAVKELNAKVEALEAQVAELEA